MNPNKQDHLEDTLALGVVLLPIIIVIALIAWSDDTKPKGTNEYKGGDHSEIIREDSRDDRHERHLQDLEDEAEAERMAPDWY